MTVIVVASDVRQETSRAFGLLKFQRTLRRRSDDARGDALAPAAGRASPDGGFARARGARAPRGRSPGAPSPAPPSRGSFSAASSSDAARSGGTSVGGSREWGLGALSGRPPSDAELAAAEERADALKERFALATDPGEQEELLELATEATLLVNTMRAERAFTPAHARAAADEARRALAPERKMLAELLEDASSRREERDARASHALVDVVRARSPVRPAPPRAPVDERVPPARASPTGDAILRPRRASASPARGDAPLPPFGTPPRTPARARGTPSGRLRRHAPGPVAGTPRVANRRAPRARSSVVVAREARGAVAAARNRRRRPFAAAADHPRVHGSFARNALETTGGRLRRGTTLRRGTLHPRVGVFAREAVRRLERRRAQKSRRRELGGARGGDSTAAHAARPRGARAGQDHLRAAEARALAEPRRRASVGDGRGRERRRGEGEAARRARRRGARGGSRRREGVGRGEVFRRWITNERDAKRRGFIRGGIRRRGDCRGGGSSERANPPPRASRDRLVRERRRRRRRRRWRRLRFERAAAGEGADRPARALGGEGGGRRARGRVRPAGGDAEEEARRGRRERVGRGGGALGRGERLRLVVARGRSSPARRVPGGGEVLRAPGQGEVAGGGARGSGRRGRGGSDAGVDAREEETGGDAGADRAALVRDRVRGGFLGAPPRVVRFRRPRVGLVRRARRRFGRRGRCASGGALGGAAGAGGARRARGGGGGGGRGEGSRRPR